MNDQQPPPGPYGQPPHGQQGPPPGQPHYGQPPPGQYGQPPPGQYGQPPPGQYGQPPPGQYGQPPWQSGGTKTLLIVGGAVVAVAVIAVVLVLTLGGSSDEPSADSPTDTVEGFLTALEDGDCEAAQAFVTDNVPDLTDDCDPDAMTGAMQGVEFGDPDQLSEEGDGAIVSVPVEVDLDSMGEGLPGGTDMPPGAGDMFGDISLDVPLVREGDVWLIDGMPAPNFDDVEMPDFGDMPEPGPAG